MAGFNNMMIDLVPFLSERGCSPEGCSATVRILRCGIPGIQEFEDCCESCGIQDTTPHTILGELIGVFRECTTPLQSEITTQQHCILIYHFRRKRKASNTNMNDRTL